MRIGVKGQHLIPVSSIESSEVPVVGIAAVVARVAVAAAIRITAIATAVAQARVASVESVAERVGALQVLAILSPSRQWFNSNIVLWPNRELLWLSLGNILGSGRRAQNYGQANELEAKERRHFR